MHIDAIDVFHVALPLREPQPTPWGRPLKRLESVLVRITSGGVSGWGEASPGSAPLAGPEWASGVYGCVRDWLAPLLVKTGLQSGQELQERLATVQGNRYAKAALDTAWWDLHARLLGQPLHEVLGKTRDAVEIGASFDRMETIDQLFEALGKAFGAGYSRVELKFRPGLRFTYFALLSSRAMSACSMVVIDSSRQSGVRIVSWTMAWPTRSSGASGCSIMARLKSSSRQSISMWSRRSAPSTSPGFSTSSPTWP